jgi:hypothetical protein
MVKGSLRLMAGLALGRGVGVDEPRNSSNPSQWIVGKEKRTTMIKIK